MPPVAIVMAILGCADDGMQCQLVQQLPTTYVSVTACNKAAETELAQFGSLDYPTIMARCQAASSPLVADATLTTAR
jgi:hypothetical protein